MNYVLWPLLAVAVIAGIAVGAWQLYVIFSIIYPEWGLVGLVVAYIFFPLTVLFIPFYSGFVFNDWSYMLFYPAAITIYAVASISWALLKRQESDQENVAFMKPSIIGFVDDQDQGLPLESLGRPLIPGDGSGEERRPAAGEMMDRPERMVVGGQVVEMFSVRDIGDWDKRCPDCGHEFAAEDWTRQDLVTDHATCGGCDRVWVLSKMADSPGGAVVTFTRIVA